jgi:hypothetical protein
MKKLLLITAAMATLSSPILAQTKNSLSANERKQGYTLLFNGKNTDGWHVYLGKDAGAWRVNGGALQIDTAAQGQGDLVTDKEYTNFELKLDWKIPVGGNSGVIFDIHEDQQFKETYLTGIEMQVLDDKGAEDNKKANHLAGSLYDLKAPTYPAKGAGEWNSIIIRKLNNHLTFWMNGKQTIDIQIGGKEWDELIQQSKFKAWKAFATFSTGHISLQDHGAAVAFRNIRIKQL